MLIRLDGKSLGEIGEIIFKACVQLSNLYDEQILPTQGCFFRIIENSA